MHLLGIVLLKDSYELFANKLVYYCEIDGDISSQQ